MHDDDIIDPWDPPTFPGFCAVCLAELEADRTVEYDTQSCRGILRARLRARTLEEPAERAQKLSALNSAAMKRRRAVALAIGFEDQPDAVFQGVSYLGRSAETMLVIDRNDRAHYAKVRAGAGTAR